MITLDFDTWCDASIGHYRYRRFYMTRPWFSWTPFVRRTKKTGLAGERKA